ncbi:CarD family transcriptional regulator [Deinococcus cellulosilyticus]|uniref:CarD family transcriptional regulator n=1 Tax=Deinococcus cellulosilyticus (strain DSM 18568 / NBRC 106333 / KACC 11606 / 5516J-15) TaxID=1223518 RepID=A0A511MXI8_DEIC1|nr:CarD family transcriptional regulator [Deinococcus cellulosilyticus]GEM45280.1 CarD family transcriptional regulator [Deinococcus cellulosilyticus NBRC 106333 = KACC 11606]
MPISLNVGDNVVYPSHGAGTIMGLSELEVMGRTQNYFEIELLKTGMQVRVPVDHAERLGLRRITPVDEIPRLLGQLVLPDMDLPAAWTPRHRREQTIMQEGNIYTIAHLVGTLHRRAQLRSLAVTERAIYEEAKHILVTEVMVALHLSFEDAKAKLEHTLDHTVMA